MNRDNLQPNVEVNAADQISKSAESTRPYQCEKFSVILPMFVKKFTCLKKNTTALMITGVSTLKLAAHCCQWCSQAAVLPVANLLRNMGSSCVFVSLSLLLSLSSIVGLDIGKAW